MPSRFLPWVASLLSLGASFAAEAPSPAPDRVPWVTSHISGSPEPALPYVVERFAPALKFKEPVDLANIPGTDRLVLLELGGRLFSFSRDGAARQPDLMLDLKQQVKGANQAYGFTFHPGFATNHFIFICYIAKDGDPNGTRVSRFEVKLNGAPTVDPDTEKIIITWFAGGHNGGCLKFGNDGFLYISTGDGAAPNPPDPFATGQDISDLLSSILRIDVDHEDPGKSYRIPVTNPFTGLPRARPEVWAYGLRNPWKMSVDPVTGFLWAGDVGWELWEMIYRVERGGNYGWSIMEGPQAVRTEVKQGPSPILPPVVSLPHSEAASITGGLVYRGSRLKELVGTYIYGDWVTGRIWGLKHDGTRLLSQGELVQSTLQVICFGEDQERELYVVDYAGGIYRLQPNPDFGQPPRFPRKLSETGLFSSVHDATPAPGVLPFSVNAEMWSDGAQVTRWLGLPGSSSVSLTNEGKWQFPSNAVLARTITLDAEKIETQILHFDGIKWTGYSYAWNAAQTDGDLIPQGGNNRIVTRPVAHTYHFHSRAECMRCHNPWAGPPLSFNATQLRSVAGAKNGVRDAIPELPRLGLIPQKTTRAANSLVSPYETRADLDHRARSWLHVNCAHCHREGAGGSVVSHFNIELKPAEMKSINQTPSQGTFTLPLAQVISPGAPARSSLVYRISTLGPSHMPRIGATTIDTAGVNLIYDWIAHMTSSADKVPVAAESAVQQESDVDAALQKWEKGKSKGERMTALGQVLQTPYGALQALHACDTGLVPAASKVELIEQGAAHSSPLVRDLFERFIPEEKRVRKLGPVIDVAAVLKRSGNASRGRSVFFQPAGPQCSQCHKVNGEGEDFGPDLSSIARKYRRPELLDQIVQPSKIIDPAFFTYQVETKEGDSYTGFMVEKKTTGEITLKDASRTLVHLQPGQVKSIQQSRISAMPEGLLQSLTEQDAADLLEFLASLN